MESGLLMMDVVAVKHCALLHGYNKVDLPTKRSHGRLRLKGRGNASPSALFSRRGEFLSRPLDSEWRDTDWNTLHFLAPPHVPARRRVSSLGSDYCRAFRDMQTEWIPPWPDRVSCAAIKQLGRQACAESSTKSCPRNNSAGRDEGTYMDLELLSQRSKTMYWFRIDSSCSLKSGGVWKCAGQRTIRAVDNIVGNDCDSSSSLKSGVGWKCAGQGTISAVDNVVGNEHELLVEEEQKSLLKKKADVIVKDLRGTCIFLVGMMGSGKTTVGKYIAEALGYYFFDSDKLVEDAAHTTVSQMFRAGREEEFRNAESEVLMQLSSMGRLVVATGGGAVVRPQNWGYLRHGITVWLDVPLDALARRVVAVGCESRPLLGQVSPESAYHQALNCLTHLFEERRDYYSNADTVVSVAELANSMGLDDVTGVTPVMLAVQVLEEITILIRDAERRKHKR